MSEISLHALRAGSTPGVPSALVGAVDRGVWLPTAAPRLRDLDAVELRSGPAWSDDAWRAEMEEDHRRRGADAASLRSLERLGQGAACVITGQQPGLLLGPLYTVYKILGAIALARALERARGVPVVPVYWCGSDDSDFEEIRRAWLWEPGAGAFRAELDAAAWSVGQRVGSVRGEHIAAVENSALERLGDGDGALRLREWHASLSHLDELTDRVAGWAHRALAGTGLVVVDARSRRLRELGSDLFTAYRERHTLLHEVLLAHGDALADHGWSTPLDERALASGLFALDGERRRKLEADELDAYRGEVAPSVLLRPLWQDHLLAPAAVVLGPAELQYHAQIAPLYRELSVRPPQLAPRPHVTLWPARAPWLGVSEGVAPWLAGGEELEAAIARTRLPRAWAEALDRAASATSVAYGDLAKVIDEDDAQAELDRARARAVESWDALRDRLARVAARRDDVDPRLAAAWLGRASSPQERTLSALQLWWCHGDATPEVLDRLATSYVDAIVSGEFPAWVVRGGRSW